VILHIIFVLERNPDMLQLEQVQISLIPRRTNVLKTLDIMKL